jgi:hypothetical protein
MALGIAISANRITGSEDLGELSNWLGKKKRHNHLVTSEDLWGPGFSWGDG